MSNKLGLTQEEENKIKLVCEYLFFDQFTEIASYKRFERCFQPLFSDEPDLDLEDLFEELCGTKKKYLNYKRFVNSYLKYKKGQVSKEATKFFDKLFNSILEKNTVGTLEQGRLTFSTRKANKKRECISLIEVLNDKEGVIHGINIEFDGNFKNKLYPKKIEDSLSVGLEVSLKILDEEKLEKRGISKYLKANYFRDAITHMFGTIDQDTKYITFLGFKCVSGKTQFLGFPKGKSFIFGEFGKKLQQLKCQMTNDGITSFVPYFEKNQRPNHYLSKNTAQLTLEDLAKDELILDEEYLNKLTDKNEIEKFITTNLIDDTYFFNSKLKDEIAGNNLKEVINKKPKKWMVEKKVKKIQRPHKFFSLNEFMHIFEEEHRRRTRFYRGMDMRYFGYAPKKGLLSRERMHRRRRLRPFAFGYEEFPYEGISPFMSSHYFPQSSFKGFDSYGPQKYNQFDYQRGYNTYDNNYGGYDYYGNQSYNNNNIVLRARPKTKDEVEKTKNLPQIVGQKNNELEKEGEENDDEEVLIPDEHPEETTSLEELEEKLESIIKLLDKKDINEEESKKLLKLKKLYLQQKNILLDNEEKKEKEEILKKNDIKVNDYIKKEKEKRDIIEENEEKLIRIEIEENADKTESTIISVITKPNPEKIFRKQEIYKGQKPWNDPLFTPCKDNLCPSNESGWILPEDVLITDVDGWEKYNWCRVEDIVNSKNYKVFEDGISPNDIIQGSIGDCYFLSAIGSLCKFSHYIDKLFFTKEKTKEHLYGVFIFLNGSWKLVLVDDYLPYSGKRFRKFAFSSSGGKELWVALLEKAWAKINGSYAKIGCGGSPTEVFDILTEAYSEQIPISPYYKDYIWETMYDSEKKGYIMTAGTSSDIFNLNLEGVGLSAGHAYTVLGVLEIDTGKGIEKVVRLRNPYGNGEFNGDWSDYSKKWTPELKKKYNLVISDDGDFYMGYDDFLNYYITLGICKLQPGYKTTSVKMAYPTKCQVTKITVPTDDIHAYLQLYQKNPRVQLKDGTYHKLVYCYLLLVDKDFNYIYSVFNRNMHIGIEQKLKQGTYYLISDVNYRYANPDKKPRSYRVTCYAQTPLNIENVTNQIDTTKAIQKAIYSYCRQYVPPTQCSNGVYLYRTSTNMDSIPFEAAVFENYTNNNYRVKVNVVGKGEKSFCFYEDEIVSEKETSAIKELPTNSVAVFSVLKYSLSSIFSLKYFFASLKPPFGNTLTAQKSPQIYKEKSTLKPETQDNKANNQFATQDQNIQNNAEYINPQQQYLDNNANIPYGDQNINSGVYQPQNMEYNTQFYNDQYNAQYDVQSSGQFIGQNNGQNIQAYNQYYNQNYPQFAPQSGIQSFNQNAQYINQNVPKKNKKNNLSISKNKIAQNNPQYINTMNVQNNNRYNTQNNLNYIQNNITYPQQNQNMLMNISYNTQNNPKSNYVSTQNKKKTINPVFKTQGQVIDESGVLVQYAMINGDNYVIGLENRSNMKIKLQLLLEGLVISNNGKSYAVFYSNPRERKIFNTKILPNYSYDQIAFEFQYA